MIRARATTAADVAAAAGVSRATVSHILNGREANFPESTRQRVREAAAALDYRPSPAGRSLVRGHSDLIVLLLPGWTVGSNIQAALHRMTRDSSDLRANVVLRVADEHVEQTVEGLLRLRPLGVVDMGALNGAARDRLRAQGIALPPEGPVDSVVDADVYAEIARLQLQALAVRPGQRVFYVAPGDTAGGAFAAPQERVFRRIAAEQGIDDIVTVRITTDDPEVSVVSSILSGATDRVPVAAYNDLAALAVLSAAQRVQPRPQVPQELSIVGLDATVEGRLWSPRLTSVSVDLDAIVHASMQALRIALGVVSHPDVDTSSRIVRLAPGATTPA